MNCRIFLKKQNDKKVNYSVFSGIFKQIKKNLDLFEFKDLEEDSNGNVIIPVGISGILDLLQLILEENTLQRTNNFKEFFQKYRELWKYSLESHFKKSFTEKELQESAGALSEEQMKESIKENIEMIKIFNFISEIPIMEYYKVRDMKFINTEHMLFIYQSEVENHSMFIITLLPHEATSEKSLVYTDTNSAIYLTKANFSNLNSIEKMTNEDFQLLKNLLDFS